jgi:phosphate/sulfate permease
MTKQVYLIFKYILLQSICTKIISLPRNEKPTTEKTTTEKKTINNTMALTIEKKIVAASVAACLVAVVVVAATQSRLDAAFGIGIIFAFLLAFSNGANDIANSVGTSMGCGAMNMKQAVVFGSIFECLGILIMGQYVAKNITKGVLSANDYIVSDSQDLFAFCMVCSLTAATLVTLLATFSFMPISITHATVGALTAVGMAAKGTASVGWEKLGIFVIGWIFSPLISMLLTCLLYLLINKLILKRAKPLAAAQFWYPAFMWATLSVSFMFIIIKVIMLAFISTPLLKLIISSFPRAGPQKGQGNLGLVRCAGMVCCGYFRRVRFSVYYSVRSHAADYQQAFMHPSQWGCRSRSTESW